MFLLQICWRRSSDVMRRNHGSSVIIVADLAFIIIGIYRPANKDIYRP